MTRLLVFATPLFLTSSVLFAASPAANPTTAPVTATLSRGGLSESGIIAAELLVGSLTATGIGLAGYYAASYAPSHPGVPQSTAGSQALNLGGVAILIAGPAIVGRVVCAIGRVSSDYEGTCLPAIGLAYAAVVLVPVAALLTRRQEPSQGELDFLGPSYSYSAAAMLGTYIGGIALGATIGWNCWKDRKGDPLALQPIFRAGPPPEGIADWTGANSGPRTRSAVAIRALDVPLLAFAF